MPRTLKDSLAPLPPALDEAVDAPADGKTAGGAAPAVTNTRQQMLGPGPPGPIPNNNLIIHNNFTERVYVVTAGVQFTRPGYFPGVPATTPADRWAVTGWFWVEPQQKTLVFTTRANKAWFYAQTNGGTHVWGGNNATDVAVYPDDVPFSTAAGGYVSSFTTSPTPKPVIHPCVFFLTLSGEREPAAFSLSLCSFFSLSPLAPPPVFSSTRPPAHSYYMQQYNFNNGLFDAINMDGIVTLNA